MVFALIKSRRVIKTCIIITISVLVLISYKSRPSKSIINYDINYSHVAAAAQGNGPTITKRVAVPFGKRTIAEHVGTSHLPKEKHIAVAKRADPDTLSLEQAVINGNKYLDIIAAGQPKPPIWTQADYDIGEWKEKTDYPRTIDDSVKTALQDLKISTDAADVLKTEAQQFTDFDNMDCELIVDDQSGGQYLHTYIPGGALSRTYTTTTYFSQMGLPRPTPQELRKMIPRLNRWSDVAWFLWAQKAGDQAGDLRYIFKDNVINKNTKAVMDQVLKVPSNTLDLPWPGKTFDVRTGNDGKALLGSPLGSGIAWLLADNKQILGERSLKITCFTSDAFFKDEKKNNYYLLFELVRV